VSELVTVAVDDGVAVVQIDNPPVNALDRGVREALAPALARVAADAAVRAVVIACAGRTFVAGADIGELERAAWSDGIGPDMHPLLAQVEDLPKPIIAAIHGTALGGGLELAMACHYRVAVDGARLGLPEVTLGIIPGAGGTQRLPRLIATGRAKRLLFTGDRIGAAEALELGLVDEVTAAGESVNVARALAERIARNAPLAVAAAKRAVNLGLEMGVVDAHRLEATLFAQLAGTRDFVEGVSAFFDKREPAFTRE
jgi:enoyl-CoA hydratase